MQRRVFLRRFGSTVAGGMIPGGMAALPAPLIAAPAESSEFLSSLIAANDGQIPDLLARQEQSDGHPWFGGLPDHYGIHTPQGTAQLIQSLAAAYASRESAYRGAAVIRERIRAAAGYLLAAQHQDGTIDLLTTNFHSPPDTAFVLEPLCAVVAVLQSLDDPALTELLDALGRFIRAAAEALTVGGIHTANHRWVVCMSLARAHALFSDRRYVDRIDQWLAEGIDIDPDGQYSERSAGVYSPLTNRCLVTVSRLLGRPELLAPVRKNLDMTMYHVHADGQVVTSASRRRDRNFRGSLARYYLPYRYLAAREQNGQFAAMARWIESLPPHRLTRDLIYLLEDPTLRQELPPEEPLPTNYERAFLHAGLVRIRRGDLSATICAGQAEFFSLHKGTAVLEAVRVATSFFGKGQFVGQEIGQEHGRWILRSQITAPYYQPLRPEDRQPAEPWKAMHKSLRAQSEVQRLTYTIAIAEEDGRFDIELEIQGTDGVPVAIELAFRPGGTLSGVRPHNNIEGAYLLQRETGSFRQGNQTIEFGPGQASHQYTQLRGALPKMAADSVYITGFTPFQTSLRIR